MRRIVHVALLLISLTLGTLGCAGLTRPDGGDMNGLIEWVRGLPIGDGARREEAHWRSVEDLRNGDPSDVIGNVVCRDARGNSSDRHIMARDIIECLAASDLTFAECVQARVDDFIAGFRAVGEHYGISHPDDECAYTANPAYHVDPKWDPAKVTDEDLARQLIESDVEPQWLNALGLAGIGGMLWEMLPGLCALTNGDHWSCPDNPNYTTAPQPGAGGGDR